MSFFLKKNHNLFQTRPWRGLGRSTGQVWVCLRSTGQTMGSVYAQRVCLHTTGKTVGSVYAFHVNLGVCTRSTGQSLRVCLRSTGQFFGSVCPLRVNLLGSIYAPEVRLWGPSALYRTISGSDCALQVTVGGLSTLWLSPSFLRAFASVSWLDFYVFCNAGTLYRICRSLAVVCSKALTCLFWRFLVVGFRVGKKNQKWKTCT